MIHSKHMNRLCALAAALMVLLAGTLMVFRQRLQEAYTDPPYAARLFTTQQVHQVDLLADPEDWQSMLDNALAEEYIACSVVVDGEAYRNVGIRPKGNSSLTTVAQSDSDRYSFKLEFDHYDKNQTYYGLDKLCLNNAIQDNTYMKDYLCYTMLASQGAEAPLTSYVWVTVNGEDWGLYLAVEGIEEAFAQRIYGKDYGQLYKPDSMGMGGGALPRANPQEAQSAVPRQEDDGAGTRDKGFGAGGGGFPGFGGGLGGSEDVLLQYSSDDPADYPNIFDNAVFDTVTDGDQARLLAALRRLDAGEVESCVNMKEVLAYFAVHNFVLNGDSYTGSMVHNYYLHEQEGLLSMVAWDYNLAFGGMDGGTATEAVNSPIDSPVSSGDISERPMAAWLFANEAYTAQYHEALENFLAQWFDNGACAALIDQTAALIGPYVERDPTAFCTYEEFTLGVETLKEFCQLRAQSVRAQLEGEIPSTRQTQEEGGDWVDASHLTLADMGSQGGGAPEGGAPRAMDRQGEEDFWANQTTGDAAQEGGTPEAPEGNEQGGQGNMPAWGGEPPEGFTPGQAPPEGMGGFSAPWEEAGQPEASPSASPESSAEPDGSPQPDAGGQEEQGRGFQMPEGFAPGENAQGAFPVEEGAGGTRWLYLAGSLVLLGAGLAFAKFFR